ncbi:hypothetical protein [Kitasatospora sp. Root107]|uniref:hypothetical protein n=1 Tax=Kitasatospora sp. Root107 TaxID=1736424 RepID=UPI00070BC2C7|nr:hypothetical protein [Kitasatospora sp. Root107]KQV16627.1 hypothetical protein ASC99_28045 [Kitasatospora sp. Root107]
MSSDQQFEEDLTYAMSRTGEAFRTETAQLDAVGLERGRRAWRRRSAAVMAGSATALALVGGGTFLVMGRSGPAASFDPAVSVVSSDVPSPDGPSGAAASTAASGSTGTAGPVPVPTERVLAALKTVLPAGSISGVEGLEGRGIPATGAMVRLRFDDGKGVGRLSVSVKHLARQTAATAPELKCPDRKILPYDACHTSTLADGSVLTLFQGLEYPNGQADTKRWSATLSGKDGRLIEISEWNAAEDKGAPTTRPTPPLTTGQLSAVATARAWDSIVAELPVVGGQAVPRAEFPAEQIVATAAKLLPAGLTPADANTDMDGYANFTVKDAKGASLVEINVQDWRRDLAQPSGSVISGQYANGQALADGSRVVESQEGKNPGRWIVEVLRADGLRVVVAAYNSGGLQQAATRQTPVLTTEQLRAIALSPEWKLPS